jgi:hypothetical protein
MKKIVSCKIFEPLGFRIQQPGSTPFKGHHFGAKTSRSTWNGSTSLISGSGLPKPDRLTCYTIQRCLLDEIRLLRNQISLCQHVFYYNKYGIVLKLMQKKVFISFVLLRMLNMAGVTADSQLRFNRDIS